MRERATKPLLSALCDDTLWSKAPEWRHAMCRNAGGRFITDVRDVELTDGECTCPCHKIVENILDKVTEEVYTLSP